MEDIFFISQEDIEGISSIESLLCKLMDSFIGQGSLVDILIDVQQLLNDVLVEVLWYATLCLCICLPVSLTQPFWKQDIRAFIPQEIGKEHGKGWGKAVCQWWANPKEWQETNKPGM